MLVGVHQSTRRCSVEFLISGSIMPAILLLCTNSPHWHCHDIFHLQFSILHALRLLLPPTDLIAILICQLQENEIFSNFLPFKNFISLTLTFLYWIRKGKGEMMCFILFLHCLSFVCQCVRDCNVISVLNCNTFTTLVIALIN